VARPDKDREGFIPHHVGPAKAPLPPSANPGNRARAAVKGRKVTALLARSSVAQGTAGATRIPGWR